MKFSLKKTLLAAALVVIMIASMTVMFACDPSEIDPKVVGIPMLTDTRSTEEEMVTITTLDGREVTYNKNSRKIAALSNEGDLVSFGIRPLVVMTQEDIKKAYPDFFNGIPSLENTQPFSEEEIMNYHPELIVVQDIMDEANIAKLEKIAPVITLPRDESDLAKRLGYIGEVFGMKENADKLIASVAKTKAEFLEKADQLGIKGKTVTVFYDLMGAGSVMVPPMAWWDFNAIIYDVMGAKQTEAAKNMPMESMMTPISNEKIREFEGEIVIWADVNAVNGKPAIPEAVKNNPGWMVLKAVQENRVGLIDGLLYAEKDVLYLAEQYTQMLSAFKVATKK